MRKVGLGELGKDKEYCKGRCCDLDKGIDVG